MKKIFRKRSGCSNKRLSSTLLSSMTMSDLAVLIAVQMGDMDDSTTSMAPLSTFRGFACTNLDQYLSQFLTTYIANNGRIEDI